ncbi:MAG: hypothetical protein C4527_28940 [Candidatus Omnitrophota bacterium]|jgi:hypothetical protein|nr:MAG: hypothetical protein C4527_28940 [Candidatus Omnitrophota bacterium]
MKPDPSLAQRNLFLLHHFHNDVAKALHEHMREQRRRGEIPPYRVEPTPSGLPTLVKINESQRIVLHTRPSPLAPMQAIAQELSRQPPGATLIFSCGLGYLPCALAPLLNRMKVIVLETDYDILLEALRMNDWGAIMPSGNLLLLAGKNAMEEANILISKHGSLLKNGIRFFPGRILLDEETPTFTSLQTIARESQEIFNYRITSNLQVKKGSYAIVAGHAHKELLSVLCEEAGHVNMDARPVLRRPAVTQFVQTPEMWWESLGRPLPAKLLTFTNKAFLPSEWDKMKAFGIRRFLWCYDDPFRATVDDTFFHHLDRIYCFDPFLTKRLQKQSPIPVHFLPEATAFSEGAVGPPPWDIPSTLPVTFVGSTGLQRQDDRLPRLVSSRDPSYLTIRQFVLDALAKDERIHYDELMALPVEFPNFHKSARVVLLEDLATFVVRLHFLAALVNTPAKIFGDQAWLEPALVGDISRIYAGRNLDYLRQTPWVYQNSKININIFNVQCVNAPTVRIFDVMACGGFLLTEYRPFTEELFRIGVELDVFHSHEELREKVIYYLEQEEQRERIARAGQERVMREHRFRHRLPLIFAAE